MKQDFTYTNSVYDSATSFTYTYYSTISTLIYTQNSGDSPINNEDTPYKHNSFLYINASPAIGLLLNKDAHSKPTYNKDTLLHLLNFIYKYYSKPFHYYILALIDDEKIELVEEWLKYIPSLKSTLTPYLHHFMVKNRIDKLNPFDHIFKLDKYKLITEFLYSNKSIISSYLESIEYNSLLINYPAIQKHWSALTKQESSNTTVTSESFAAATLSYYANLDTLLVEKRKNSTLRWPSAFEIALLANDTVLNYYVLLYKEYSSRTSSSNILIRKEIIKTYIKSDISKHASEYKYKLSSIIAENINHPVIIELAPWAFHRSKAVLSSTLEKLDDTIVQSPTIFMELMNQDKVNVSLLPFFQNSFIYHALLGRSFGLDYIETARISGLKQNIEFQSTALALSNRTFKANLSNLFTAHSDCIWKNMILQHSTISPSRLSHIKKFAMMYTVASHKLNTEYRSSRINHKLIFDQVMHADGVEYTEYHLFNQYHKQYKAKYDLQRDNLFPEYIHNLFSSIYHFLQKRFPFIELEQFVEFAQLLESQHNDSIYSHTDFKWKFTSILGKRLHHLELVQSRSHNRPRGISNYSPRFVHACGEENKVKIL
ncbi:MAG: hypothetical protein ACK5WS_02005, partial [Alphaproteobacteria bacterium]